MADRALAALIDHTLLRPDAAADDLARLCDEAIEHGFFAVCVQPTFVTVAARRVAGCGVRVASVAAFPHGASTTAAKCFEVRCAVDDGADEIDVVANLRSSHAPNRTSLRRPARSRGRGLGRALAAR